MNWRFTLVSMLGFALASSPAAGATLGEMIANLQRLQVRETAGDKAAYDAQAPLVRSMGAQLKVERDAANYGDIAIGAIIYLLNGGTADEVIRLIREKAFSKNDEPLVRGALAYTQGRMKEATAAIGDVDPRSLDLRIAAHFCYILSVVEPDRGYARSIELLDLARLLAPGGLVEEASIRREVTLVAEAGDPNRLLSLTRQYVARFGQSLFLDKFVQSLTATLETSNLSNETRFVDQLDEAIAPLSAARRQNILLAIARAKLLAGNYAAAENAADKVLHDLQQGTVDEARGRLYRTIAHVLESPIGSTSGELDSIASDKLTQQDKLLLSLARRLIAGIHAWSIAPEAAIANALDDAAGVASSETIDAGKRLLEHTATLVSSGAKK